MSDTKVPAYTTLRFWGLALATVIGLLMSSGLVLHGTLGTVIGWVSTLLAAMGFHALPTEVDG